MQKPNLPDAFALWLSTTAKPYKIKISLIDKIDHSFKLFNY